MNPDSIFTRIYFTEPDGRIHLMTIDGHYQPDPPKNHQIIQVSPAQLIDLLNWLQQERATLEQLAKEQG